MNADHDDTISTLFQYFTIKIKFGQNFFTPTSLYPYFSTIAIIITAKFCSVGNIKSIVFHYL